MVGICRYFSHKLGFPNFGEIIPPVGPAFPWLPVETAPTRDTSLKRMGSPPGVQLRTRMLDRFAGLPDIEVRVRCNRGNSLARQGKLQATAERIGASRWSFSFAQGRLLDPFGVPLLAHF